MTHDRQITISTAGSRRALNWRTDKLLWSELTDRLKRPARGTEAQAEYIQMTRGQQDELKDVGGYVGGELAGSRRKVGQVAGRDILTLDLDNIPAGETEEVVQRVDALGCGFAISSTRKHRPSAPRLRVLIPMDRTLTADEYEPVARRAEIIGLTYCDQTTFETNRLMFWPSASADGEYIYRTKRRAVSKRSTHFTIL